MGMKNMTEVLSGNMTAYENKAKLTFGKLAILAIFAGMFIAIGASSSSAAIYGIANTGLAKTLAGAIFPAGLIMVVFVGGELFTGDCLMVLGVMNKRVKLLDLIRVLVLVYIFNLIGSLIVAGLVYECGQLGYGDGALAAAAIKTSYAKMNLTFGKAVASGIMCNVLVCLAVLLAGCATDAAGKILAIFFPIWAFVIGGYEHCVANMYYIPIGLIAKMNDTYYQAAINAGMTADQLDSMNWFGFFVTNQIPVTIGNILGGMVFVALPLFIVHKAKLAEK